MPLMSVVRYFFAPSDQNQFSSTMALLLDRPPSHPHPREQLQQFLRTLLLVSTVFLFRTDATVRKQKQLAFKESCPHLCVHGPVSGPVGPRRRLVQGEGEHPLAAAARRRRRGAGANGAAAAAGRGCVFLPDPFWTKCLQKKS